MVFRRRAGLIFPAAASRRVSRGAASEEEMSVVEQPRAGDPAGTETVGRRLAQQLALHCTGHRSSRQPGRDLDGWVPRGILRANSSLSDLPHDDASTLYRAYS